MQRGQADFIQSGERDRESAYGTVCYLQATLQAPAGFLKDSFDKAKVFIKCHTQGPSTVVQVEARLLDTSTQGALLLAGSHSRLLAVAVGIGG